MEDDELENLEKQIRDKTGEPRADRRSVSDNTVLQLIHEVQDLRSYCKLVIECVNKIAGRD